MSNSCHDRWNISSIDGIAMSVAQVARALWAHQKLAAPSSTKPEKERGRVDVAIASACLSKKWWVVMGLHSCIEPCVFVWICWILWRDWIEVIGIAQVRFANIVPDPTYPDIFWGYVFGDTYDILAACSGSVVVRCREIVWNINGMEPIWAHAVARRSTSFHLAPGSWEASSKRCEEEHQEDLVRAEVFSRQEKSLSLSAFEILSKLSKRREFYMVLLLCAKVVLPRGRC